MDRLAGQFLEEVKNGNLTNVEVLLKAGANVDLKDINGWTPLMFSSQFGHIDIVQELLNKKADVNLQNKGGWTALMWAS
jgi:ankyrin repeat protein